MTTPITPQEVGKAAKFVAALKNYLAKAKLVYPKAKAVLLKLWQRWKEQPVKTTGYGVIAAVVTYLAAVGLLDHNVTNLVSSLVTLGAGAPTVNAVNRAVQANVEAARAAGHAEGARQEALRQTIADKAAKQRRVVGK